MPIKVDPEEAAAVMRAAGLEPLVPYPGTQVPWPAIHQPCGREIAPLFGNVKRRGTACRKCAGDKRGAARRARKADDAVTAMHAAGFIPLEPYPGSAKPWRCVHQPCGHERTPTLNQIAAGQTACLECSRSAKEQNYWTPETALAAFLAADLEPLELYPGTSTKPWRARHVSCGAVVSPRLANLAAGQGPCNACARTAQNEAKRLDEHAARAVMLSADLQPLDPYPGVDDPWRCRHLKCGRIVTPRYFNIKKGQSGCLHCTYTALADRFRMPEAEAAATMRAHGLEPLEPYHNSNTAWRCRHTCGHEVRAVLGNVKQGKGICRYCNASFPYDGPAFIYLVSDELAHKIGIAGEGSRRLETHRPQGWLTAWTISVPTGDDAWNAEQAVLAWWRDVLGLPQVYEVTHMPQGGATETVLRADVDAQDVWTFVLAHLETMGVECRASSTYEASVSVSSQPQLDLW